MITLCAVCKKTFDKKPDKGYDLIPDVCSGRCFLQLLKRNKKKPNFSGLEKLQWISFPYRDYKSSYEVRFSNWLDEWGMLNGQGFLYEPFLFGNQYLPDFLITKYPAIIETKGRWESGALKKVRALKEYLQDVVPVYVVNQDLLRRLSK